MQKITNRREVVTRLCKTSGYTPNHHTGRDNVIAKLLLVPRASNFASTSPNGR